MYSYIVNLISKKFFSVDKDDMSDEGNWTRYYIEVFLVNIFKTLLILFFSLILNTFVTTIISLICFRQLRKYANGWHSEFSGYCSFQCLCFFVFMPKLLDLLDASFDSYVLSIFFLVELLLFWMYSQIESEEPLIIKKKICITLSLFFGLSFLFKNISSLQHGIIIGVFAEGVLILPVSEQLVKGDFFNEIKEYFAKKNELSNTNAVKRRKY